MGFFTSGGWSNVGTTGLSKKDTLLDSLIQKRGGIENLKRVKQGQIDYLSQYDTTRATFDDLSGKGTDSDSGYFTTDEGVAFGGRAPTILDAPEHSAYAGESSVRQYQKEHYAKLWGVPVEAVTDEHIYAMGRQADEKFNALALEGQGTYDKDLGIVERSDYEGMEPQSYLPETDVTYNPEDTKLEGTTRDRVNLTNPFTGTNLYHAMNTPEFNTRWFENTPEQNQIRAQYETEHGSHYGDFKVPYLHSNVYQAEDGTFSVYSSDGAIHEKGLTETEVEDWRREIEKNPNPLIADNWSTERAAQVLKTGYTGLVGNIERATAGMPRTLDATAEYSRGQLFKAENENFSGAQAAAQKAGKTPEDFQAFMDDMRKVATQEVVTEEQIADFKKYSLNPTLAPEGYKDSADFKLVNMWNTRILDRNLKDLLSLMEYEEEAKKLDRRGQHVSKAQSKRIADDPYDGGMFDSILFDIANRKKEFVETFLESTPHMAVAMIPYAGVPTLATLKQDDMEMAYIENYGKAPSSEQVAWMWGTSLIASRLEKLSGEVLVGKSKAVNETLDLIYNKLAAKSPLLAKAMAIPARIGLSATTESGSEMGTQYFEHIGAQDVNKNLSAPTAFEMKEAGMAGMVGGGSIATPTSIGQELLNTKKKRLNKIQQKLDIPETIDETSAVSQEDIQEELNDLDSQIEDTLDSSTGIPQKERAAARKELLARKKELRESTKTTQVTNPDAPSPKYRKQLVTVAMQLTEEIEAKEAKKAEKKALQKAKQKKAFKGTTAEYTEVLDKLNTTEELSIDQHQELLDALSDSASGYIKEWTALDGSNPEAVEQAKQKATEAIKEVKAQKAKFDAREDVNTTQEDLKNTERKNEYVYSLGKTETTDVDDINAYLTSNSETLTSAEISILEAKKDAIATKQNLDVMSKNLESVKQDVLGNENAPDVSKDFISFEKHRRNVESGKNRLGAISKLKKFATHMQEKAKLLKQAYARVAGSDRTEVVTLGNSTWTIHTNSGEFVDYVGQEAAYGQRIVDLVDNIAETKLSNPEASIDTSKHQRDVNELLTQKISKLEDTAPKDTTKVGESEQTKSVEGEAKDVNEILKSKQTQKKHASEPKKVDKENQVDPNDLLKSTTKEIPAKDNKGAGTESDTKQDPNDLLQSTSTVETKEVKSTEETQAQGDLFGDSTNEVKDAFAKAGVLTKLGTVYAEGSLSLDQWKTAAKKLGVLPDGC